MKTEGVQEARPLWAQMERQDAAQKETDQEKLKRTNVWDFAANAMQAGAYQG